MASMTTESSCRIATGVDPLTFRDDDARPVEKEMNDIRDINNPALLSLWITTLADLDEVTSLEVLQVEGRWFSPAAAKAARAASTVSTPSFAAQAAP
eukprot:COSAG02_NODE_3757_length_6277_cov_1.750405_1_plen_97_part_00